MFCFLAEHGCYEICKILLDAGAKSDYLEKLTDEPFPRTTLCDEPLRLALRNKHYVSLLQDRNKRELPNISILGGCKTFA